MLFRILKYLLMPSFIFICLVSSTISVFAKDVKEPLFFPEQELFKETNEIFLKWKNGGDPALAGQLLKVYGKLGFEKCKSEYEKDFEAAGRCKVRAIVQSVVVYDSMAESTDKDKDHALQGIIAALEIINNRKLQPKSMLEYGTVYNDDFLNASGNLLWASRRSRLIEQGIIVGDPVCEAYEHSIPHFMRVKEYERAVNSIKFFIDKCGGKTVADDKKLSRFRLLGQLAEAYAGANAPEKARLAAKERYYLIPNDEAAKSYIKLLNTNINKAEIANVTVYGSKIQKKIDRWFKLNPRPTSGGQADFLAYDQRVVSLYKNALEATDKLRLEGYETYLLDEYNKYLEAVNQNREIIQTIRSARENEQKRQVDSDKSIGDFFDFIEGVQKLRK